MRQRIYIDNSVIGGYFDEIYADDTKALFKRAINNEVVFVFSDLTSTELTDAPKQIIDNFFTLPENAIENVIITHEARELAEKYIKEKVISQKSRVDAQHIALATILKVDVLVSWNFKHIVNLDRIRGYNSINLRLGYPIIEIRSPKEILKYGND